MTGIVLTAMLLAGCAATTKWYCAEMIWLSDEACRGYARPGASGPDMTGVVRYLPPHAVPFGR